MKHTEIRVGNLFQDEKSKAIIPVIELGRNGEIVFDFMTYEKWQAEPIRLTKEWIEKFDFETNVGDSQMAEYYSKEEPLFGIAIHDHLEQPENDHVWDASFTNAPCNYVHQLQNLFFALTGKELVLKPTEKAA